MRSASIQDKRGILQCLKAVTSSAIKLPALLKLVFYISAILNDDKRGTSKLSSAHRDGQTKTCKYLQGRLTDF